LVPVMVVLADVPVVSGEDVSKVEPVMIIKLEMCQN